MSNAQTPEKQSLHDGNGRDGDQFTFSNNWRNGDVKKDGSSKLSKITVIIVILTFFNIILLIIVTSITIGVLNKQKPIPAPRKTVVQDLCVLCSVLEQGEYEQTKKLCKEGKKEFCIKDGEQMKRVLDTLIDGKLRREKAKGTLIVNKYVYVDKTNHSHILSDGKPAAHLLAIEELQRNKRDGTLGHTDNSLRSWSNEKDSSAFMQNGIDYRHGRLIIPISGRYYVYSQVHFQHPINQQQMDQSHQNYTEPISPHSLTTAHYIYRHNARYPNAGHEKLLENTQSKCIELDQTAAEYTSYLGAVLDLRAADELFVKVSNLTLVKQKKRNTYFGVYLI